MHRFSKARDFNPAARWGVVLTAAVLASLFAGSVSGSVAGVEMPSVEAVLRLVEQRLSTIDDISASVDMQQIRGDGAVNHAQAEVLAKPPHLVRFTYLKPDAVAGMFIIVDQTKDQAQTYFPVLDQVVFTSIDKLLADRSLPISTDQLFSLPSPDDYHLTVVAVEAHGEARYAIVTAKSKRSFDEATFHFSVDLESGLITGMKMYNGSGRLEIELQVNDVRVNRALSDAQLLRLPAGAQRVLR